MAPTPTKGLKTDVTMEDYWTRVVTPVVTIITIYIVFDHGYIYFYKRLVFVVYLCFSTLTLISFRINVNIVQKSYAQNTKKNPVWNGQQGAE